MRFLVFWALEGGSSKQTRVDNTPQSTVLALPCLPLSMLLHFHSTPPDPLHSLFLLLWQVDDGDVGSFSGSEY